MGVCEGAGGGWDLIGLGGWGHGSERRAARGIGEASLQRRLLLVLGDRGRGVVGEGVRCASQLRKRERERERGRKQGSKGERGKGGREREREGGREGGREGELSFTSKFSPLSLSLSLSCNVPYSPIFHSYLSALSLSPTSI